MEKNSKGIPKGIVSAVAILYSVYTLLAVLTYWLQPLQQLSLFLSFGLALCFLKYPLSEKRPESKPFLLIDCILIVASFLSGIYILLDYQNMIFRVGDPNRYDVLFGLFTTVLVLEATRRAIGKLLLIIAGVFLLYVYFGEYLFPPLSHSGFDSLRITTVLYTSENGLFGVALAVMFKFIFLFILFGALFSELGGTDFFIDIASAIFGGLRGGPAKIAVVTSGFMGTISGSAVANTATTGSLTIPLMKRIGFESHVAGAVEAAASSGGALMPPVMGAAAFVMSDYLGVPYIDICKAALIPGILYYIAIFAIIHFYSMKIGLKGLPKSELPVLSEVIRKRWFYFFPLIILIVLLIRGHTPTRAITYTMLSTVILSLLNRNNRINIKKALAILEKAAMNSLIVTTACATAGIVIGVVLLTGLGIKITDLVLLLSGNKLFVALPLIMIASLIFGMGLPTVVCYVLLSVTVAAPIIQMGATPIAAHLFIFYFGMLCMVTPPIGFAAYAGAAIAQADTMKTSFSAWMFASAGFLLPYVFVYNNSLLLMGDIWNIVLSIVTATIGVICLGSGIIGFARKRLNKTERFLIFLAALTLIKPGVLTDITGIAIAVYVFSRRDKGFADPALGRALSLET